MAKFDFKFSVLCPACGNLAEFNHFSIEVIADGVDLGKCKCGAIIQCNLTPRAAGGAFQSCKFCNDDGCDVCDDGGLY